MITVKHRLGAYEINLCEIANLFQGLPKGSLVITDQHVEFQYKNRIQIPYLAVQPGEESKSTATFVGGLNWLASVKAIRSTTLVAFGGGVIGDLGGFIAACYMRGIRLVMIPTTLLAMVDSSVGGKVGIDLPSGKNLVGAFYPPSEVRICTELLETLPPREMRNGFAEAIKYGFIMRPELIELSLAAYNDSNGYIEELIRKCIECKAEIVEEDEMETLGRRAILNFGHTVGHAIEAEAGYGSILHGEAISIGMVVEAELGHLLSITSRSTVQQISDSIQRLNLPVWHHALQNPTNLIERMKLDKKTSQTGFKFSLVSEIGKCSLYGNVSLEHIAKAITEVSKKFQNK